MDLSEFTDRSYQSLLTVDPVLADGLFAAYVRVECQNVALGLDLVPHRIEQGLVCAVSLTQPTAQLARPGHGRSQRASLGDFRAA